MIVPLHKMQFMLHWHHCMDTGKWDRIGKWVQPSLTERCSKIWAGRGPDNPGEINTTPGHLVSNGSLWTYERQGSVISPWLFWAEKEGFWHVLLPPQFFHGSPWPWTIPRLAWFPPPFCPWSFPKLSPLLTYLVQQRFSDLLLPTWGLPASAPSVASHRMTEQRQHQYSWLYTGRLRDH